MYLSDAGCLSFVICGDEVACTCVVCVRVVGNGDQMGGVGKAGGGRWGEVEASDSETGNDRGSRICVCVCASVWCVMRAFAWGGTSSYVWSGLAVHLSELKER